MSSKVLHLRGWRGTAAGAAAGLGVVAAAMAVSLNGDVDWRVSGVRPQAPNLQLFLDQPTVLQAHVLAALAALGLGGVLMWARKGRRFHRAAGWAWAALMAVTAITSLFLTGLNGDSWSLIHLLAGWTIVSLPLAVLAARRHKVKQHRGAMMGMFYGGLVIAGLLAFIPGRLMWRIVFG